jgi:hypothetical protein
MRVKDTAFIGKRWGSRFEVVKGKGATITWPVEYIAAAAAYLQ